MNNNKPNILYHPSNTIHNESKINYTSYIIIIKTVILIIPDILYNTSNTMTNPTTG
jgi:hypothetical protein